MANLIRRRDLRRLVGFWTVCQCPIKRTLARLIWVNPSNAITKSLNLLRPMEFSIKLDTVKVSKGAKIRNRYNQVPHLTQDTNGKVTNSQLDTTNESQEVSPFPAVDHKTHINRRSQKHSKHNTEKKHKRPTKEVPPWIGQ